MILVFGKTGQVVRELQAFEGIKALDRSDVDNADYGLQDLLSVSRVKLFS